MGADSSRRSAGIAVLVGVLVPLAMVGGCSLFTSLDGLSGGASDTADSATCSTCDGGSVGSDGSAPGDSSTVIEDAAKSADSSTPAGAFVCGTGTVDSCSDCAGAHQPCVTCDSSGTASPQYCVQNGDNCRDDLPPGLDAFSTSCDCSEAGASTCPEAFQVCHGSMYCHTCGEPMSSGEPCKDGGTCSGMTCN